MAVIFKPDGFYTNFKSGTNIFFHLQLSGTNISDKPLYKLATATRHQSVDVLKRHYLKINQLNEQKGLAY